MSSTILKHSNVYFPIASEFAWTRTLPLRGTSPEGPAIHSPSFSVFFPHWIVLERVTLLWHDGALDEYGKGWKEFWTNATQYTSNRMYRWVVQVVLRFHSHALSLWSTLSLTIKRNDRSMVSHYCWFRRNFAAVKLSQNIAKNLCVAAWCQKKSAWPCPSICTTHSSQQSNKYTYTTHHLTTIKTYPSYAR